MEKILKELGLDYEGQPGKNNSYIVDLSDDYEFGKVYSVLEQRDDVEQLDENTLLTIHNGSLLYMYKDYQLNLKGNFDTDEYSLVITDLVDNDEYKKEEDKE